MDHGLFNPPYLKAYDPAASRGLILTQGFIMPARINTQYRLVSHEVIEKEKIAKTLRTRTHYA